MGPHPPGSGRGRALAQAVLSAMVGAGLHRAWNHPQRVPLPTRYGGGVLGGSWGGLGDGGGPKKKIAG